MNALIYCDTHGIGDFRINSQILPLKTHPDISYNILDLPDGAQIVKDFKACGEFARNNDVRTTFHPDQFIVLSSPNPDVLERSIADLEYHAKVAEWVNADVINIHAGGVYGDKKAALMRLLRAIEILSDAVRSRLTLENDDRSYSPEDLIATCNALKVPMVYDVHHHRCLQDNLTIEQATDMAVNTWNREPLFHISSPINGWQSNDIRKHHDYINMNDFPAIWFSKNVTVEVEAKAKEIAVLKVLREIGGL